MAGAQSYIVFDRPNSDVLFSKLSRFSKPTATVSFKNHKKVAENLEKVFLTEL